MGSSGPTHLSGIAIEIASDFWAEVKRNAHRSGDGHFIGDLESHGTAVKLNRPAMSDSLGPFSRCDLPDETRKLR
jgi:hypothetical protein